MNIRPQITRYDLGPGVTAFSTTRMGGCGTGAYASFNVCHYSGDDPACVSRNREALCQLLGIGADRLLLPRQTHQVEVLAVDASLLALPADERDRRLEGIDALTTDVAGLCIGVSTADCIPLLLYDPDHRAVGAVHAGWRGTVGRIAQRAVGAMQRAYGSRPERLRAVIGPGISLASFEVGQEVYDAFAAEGFPMPLISRRWLKWHIDLPEANRLQLLDAGLAEANIQSAGVCTYEHPDVYFSARRLGIRSGRIFTGILVER